MDSKNENTHRIDVAPYLFTDFDGTVLPFALKLKDGKKIKLDNTDIDKPGYPSASLKAAGAGTRYDRFYNGKPIVLIFDDCTGIWFCEI